MVNVNTYINTVNCIISPTIQSISAVNIPSNNQSTNLSQQFLAEADLWRGGYQRPGVDEFLAGGETGLVVWFTPWGTLDSSRTRRLLQVMTPFVRIGDWGTLSEV